MEKLRVSRPVIVEGKYDKITLSAIMEGTILTTHGFSLFNQKERVALLRRLAEEKGVIVLTDSYGGGRQIRSFLSGVLPKEKVIHRYIPAVEGKERRKEKAGKAGLLGVEGMDKDLLVRLLSPYADGAPVRQKGGLTKADFYKDGLSGREGSAEARRTLCANLGFPPDMTADALLEAVNLLYTKEEYEALLRALF
jgi:ribonuclease M5